VAQHTPLVIFPAKPLSVIPAAVFAFVAHDGSTSIGWHVWLSPV
jgi:hypothetical protein